MNWDTIHSVVILVMLLAGFLAMAVKNYSQALVVPLVAVGVLVFAGTGAPELLTTGFAAFAEVAILITAVAAPADLLERSGIFRSASALIGRAIGATSVRAPSITIWLVTFSAMIMTGVMAAILHNTTAILVATPIVIGLCSNFKIPSRWVLCGSLVASNLGGFSSAWGDTPNILERRIWGLSHMDFLTEIMPLNFLVLLGIAVVVGVLTRGATIRSGESPSRLQLVWEAEGYRAASTETKVDWRLAGAGLGAIVTFISIQLAFPAYEIAAGGIAILVAVLGARANFRLQTLQAFGLDAYLILASVFVIGHAVAESGIGAFLRDTVAASDGAIWVIALSSYVGTGLTEAASWASAAAPITHAVDDSHGAAWALGAGICAGSSSLLTAASAGVLLWSQSRKHPGHEVSFASYLPFGLLVSVGMLGVYTLVLTIIWTLGS